jgi:hypothetical protein
MMSDAILTHLTKWDRWRKGGDDLVVTTARTVAFAERKKSFAAVMSRCSLSIATGIGSHGLPA